MGIKSWGIGGEAKKGIERKGDEVRKWVIDWRILWKGVEEMFKTDAARVPLLIQEEKIRRKDDSSSNFVHQ